MSPGHGDVDWARYIGVLKEIEYHGWLTLEHESGDNRVVELAAGIGYLSRFLGCSG